MITITNGMTPTQYLVALNANFKGIGTTLTEQSAYTVINDNADALIALFPTTKTTITAGMKGKDVLSALNGNFTKIDAVEDAECDTWVDRFEIPLTASQKAFYNEFYKYKFKVSSYYAKITALYIYFQHDEQAAYQNAVRDAVNEMPYNAPPRFLRFWGVESSDGLYGAYLNGGLNLSSDAKVAVNSCAIKIYKDYNPSGNGYLTGVHNTTDGKRILMYDKTTGVDEIDAMGASYIEYDFGAAPVEMAFNVSGTTMNAFKDGVKVGSSVTITGTGIPDLELFTFAINYNGSFSQGIANRLKYKVVSSSLTDVEHLALYNDLQYFITNVVNYF